MSGLSAVMMAEGGVGAGFGGNSWPEPDKGEVISCLHADLPGVPVKDDQQAEGLTFNCTENGH